MKPIVISNLREYPHWLAIVSEWLHKEWMSRYGHELSQSSIDIDRRARMESLRKHLEANEIPISLVAHDGEKPVGVVSLVRYQSEQIPSPAIWLTNLFVVPMFRQHGIGQSLLLNIQDYAKRVERSSKVIPFNSKLHLFTHDLTDYYRERGWEVVRPSVLHGLKGDIMAFNLRTAAR